MKLKLIVFLLGLTHFVYAQDKAVELIEKSEDGKVILIAKNNSENDYKVDVKINLINAKTSVSAPIEQIIKAGQEEVLVEISAEDPSQNWTYSIGYSYEKYVDQVNVLTNLNTTSVFTMNGCGRCKYTIDYLKKNNIDFTEYNTSDNDSNNLAMWQKLQEANFDGNSIKMPVIIVNNETLYNIENLPNELEKLFFN